MANFLLVIPQTIKWEGGYVNDPSDSGGATNRGITYSTYNTLCVRVLKRNPSLEHFKSLTKDEAAKFIQFYWNVATFNNSIKSQSIAECIFNWYWGSGTDGLMMWQTMLKNAFGLSKIEVDGIIGKTTVDATNSLNETELLKVAIATRKQFFIDLAKRRPKDEKFLKGWLNRLDSFAKRHKSVLEGTGAGLGLAFFFGVSLYLIYKKF